MLGGGCGRSSFFLSFVARWSSWAPPRRRRSLRAARRQRHRSPAGARRRACALQRRLRDARQAVPRRELLRLPRQQEAGERPQPPVVRVRWPRSSTQRNDWEEVVGKLRGGEMPPIEEEQPEEAAARRPSPPGSTNELERIDRVDAARSGPRHRAPPEPQRIQQHRSAICSASTSRPADDFPQDDAGYGFDNIADVLSLSPVLMEKYVTAADRVARGRALRSAGAASRR